MKLWGRRDETDASHPEARPAPMVDAAYVPLWSSEIVRVALEDAGIGASVVEQRLLPAQGLPMARVFVPADRLSEARRIIDDVIVSEAARAGPSRRSGPAAPVAPARSR